VLDSDGVVEHPGLAVAAGSIAPLKVVIVDTTSKIKDVKISDDGLLVHSLAAGAHGRNPQILIMADKKTAYVFEIPKLNKAKLVEALKFALKDGPAIVGYDTKATEQVFLDLGLEPLPVSHDVEIGAFLINSIRRETSLTELAFADLGYESSPFEDLSPEDLTTRAGELAAVIWALYDFQAESISELTKVIKLSEEVEFPVIPVLARMEYEGIGLDAGYLGKMSDELEGKISDIEQTIYGHADSEFNISSPGQLSEVLFEKMKLPTSSAQAKLTHEYAGQPWTVKKGKTGNYSTASDVLNKLRVLHPIIDCIEQYREYTKLKSTYVDTLPKQMDENGRVHTNFRMNIAPTGRLSSNDPNLQNIPVRTDLGKKIRTAFVAKPGHVFVSADYSQFELRLAASLSGDEGMIKAFNDDEDIHKLTAAEVLGIKPEEVTKQMRYNAKAVNFGIMYGQGPHGLAEGTGMSFGEAKDFIDKYFQIRPKLKAYIESLREMALNKGYVETVMGRRRPTPDVKSSNFMVREGAYRQAINMPVQGSAADLTKLAMVRVQEKLPKGSNMLLQIHDSILIETPEKDADSVGKMLVSIMQNVYPALGVKIKADVSVGKNWGEL
jgi:DNA polymerase-1